MPLSDGYGVDPPPIKRTHFFHAAIASYSIGEQ
jgi:hypothetical protein